MGDAVFACDQLRGDEQAVFSDYRKFKATSTILPGVSTVQPEPDPK